MGAQFVAGYIIEFSDGGESESGVWHVGTEEECRRTMELIPAVSYSGARPVKGCYALVRPLPPTAEKVQP